MQFTRLDPIIIGLRLCENVIASVAGAISNFADVLVMHSAFVAERQRFQRDAGVEIERLTNES